MNETWRHVRGVWYGVASINSETWRHVRDMASCQRAACQMNETLNECLIQTHDSFMNECLIQTHVAFMNACLVQTHDSFIWRVSFISCLIHLIMTHSISHSPDISHSYVQTHVSFIWSCLIQTHVSFIWSCLIHLIMSHSLTCRHLAYEWDKSGSHVSFILMSHSSHVSFIWSWRIPCLIHLTCLIHMCRHPKSVIVAIWHATIWHDAMSLTCRHLAWRNVCVSV